MEPLGANVAILIIFTGIIGQTLANGNDNSPYDVENHQWAVELGFGPESIILARRIARQLGLSYLGSHRAAEDVHLFEGRAPSFSNNNRRRRRRSVLSKRSDFLKGERWMAFVDDKLKRLAPGGYAERQVAKRRVKRNALQNAYIKPEKPEHFVLKDPMFSKSWYLNGDAASGFDMNIKAAWEAGFTGTGVVVSILDDGVERNHPDLKANYDAFASYDFNGKDSDPTPRYDSKNTNQHGTRCAGQVAAIANNSICSVGVAFNARIGGVRMLDGKVTDALEADALSLRLDHIDVFSASWGPPDDGETVDGPSHLARRALLRGVLKGRDGRGSIYVWSSGNGGLFEDSCACDGYANSIYTLSISSASERGLKPWYLEECASTIAATFSSGEPMFDRQIVTTDIRGGCTDNHTGTSASAPIAAGLVALALEANPRLTWRDVQHLVVETSKPEPLLADGNFILNGVGKRVSSRFGFGLMDGLALVRLAEQWKTVPEQRICIAAVDDLSQREIPAEVPLIVTVTVGACSGTDDHVRFLEHVEARISLWYTVRGDLEIFLTSPSGTRSQLLPPRSYDDQRGEFRDWPFVSVQFWGETAAGTWTLEIANLGPDDNEGQLRKWSLILYGTETLPATSTLHRRSTAANITLAPEADQQAKASDLRSLLTACTLPNCANCSTPTTCHNCHAGFQLSSDSSQCTPRCQTGSCSDGTETLQTKNLPKKLNEDDVFGLLLDGASRKVPSFAEGWLAVGNNAASCHYCDALSVTVVLAITLATSLPDASNLVSSLFSTQ